MVLFSGTLYSRWRASKRVINGSSASLPLLIACDYRELYDDFEPTPAGRAIENFVDEHLAGTYGFPAAVYGAFGRDKSVLPNPLQMPAGNKGLLLDCTFCKTGFSNLNR